MNGKRAKEIRAALSYIKNTIPNDSGGHEVVPLDKETRFEQTNIRAVTRPFWIGGVFQWQLPIYYTNTARHVRTSVRGAYRALKRNVLIAMRDRRVLLGAARRQRIDGFLARKARTTQYDRAKEAVHNNWIQDKPRYRKMKESV